MKRSVNGVLKIENAIDDNDLLTQVEQEVLECAQEGLLLKEVHISYQDLKKIKINQNSMIKIANYAALRITDTDAVNSNIEL